MVCLVREGVSDPGVPGLGWGGGGVPGLGGGSGIPSWTEADTPPPC